MFATTAHGGVVLVLVGNFKVEALAKEVGIAQRTHHPVCLALTHIEQRIVRHQINAS